MNNYSIAIDLGGSHVSIALVNDAGIYASRTFDVNAKEGFLILVGKIEHVVLDFLGENGLTLADCKGLGLAVPMLVDAKNRKILSAPKNKFEDATVVDLNKWVESSFDLPFVLEVDAHAACLGERFFGAGQGVDDLVFVTLGTGYGTSVIIRGNYLRGKHSKAGILGGHLSVNAGESGHSCVCPGRGCIEAETGTWALNGIVKEQPEFSESSLAAFEEINYRHLFSEAKKGDALAEKMVQRSLNLWGASLVNLTHAYDPDKIIMGGGVMNAADQILPFMNQYLRDHIWTVNNQYPEVIRAEHQESAALLGLHSLLTQNITYL